MINDQSPKSVEDAVVMIRKVLAVNVHLPGIYTIKLLNIKLHTISSGFIIVFKY